MIRRITYIACIVITFAASAQLDPLYNQYQFNQMMVNPAYTGIYNRFSASLISRLNWVGIDGAPTTNTVTLQSALNQGRIGIGGMVVDDRLGVNRNLEGSVMASYNIRFENAKLAMGLQGGFINYNFDLSKLTLDYIDDERLLVGLEPYTEPNFGFGMMYMSPTFFVGASVPRIRQDEIADGVAISTRYRRHYYFSAGYFYDASVYTQYKATVLARYVETGELSVDVAISSFIDQKVWAGLTARDLRYLGFFVNFNLTKNLFFGYSFELPTNTLIIGNYGTHEISISIDAPLEKGRNLVQRRF